MKIDTLELIENRINSLQIRLERAEEILRETSKIKPSFCRYKESCLGSTIEKAKGYFKEFS